jgi:predicted ATP-grasp superfamily ATP-dependent carboligase
MNHLSTLAILVTIEADLSAGRIRAAQSMLKALKEQLGLQIETDKLDGGWGEKQTETGQNRRWSDERSSS